LYGKKVPCPNRPADLLSLWSGGEYFKPGWNIALPLLSNRDNALIWDKAGEKGPAAASSNEQWAGLKQDSKWDRLRTADLWLLRQRAASLNVTEGAASFLDEFSGESETDLRVRMAKAAPLLMGDAVRRERTKLRELRVRSKGDEKRYRSLVRRWRRREARIRAREGMTMVPFLESENEVNDGSGFTYNSLTAKEVENGDGLRSEVCTPSRKRQGLQDHEDRKGGQTLVEGDWAR